MVVFACRCVCGVVCLCLAFSVCFLRMTSRCCICILQSILLVFLLLSVVSFAFGCPLGVACVCSYHACRCPLGVVCVCSSGVAYGFLRVFLYSGAFWVLLAQGIMLFYFSVLLRCCLHLGAFCMSLACDTLLLHNLFGIRAVVLI